MFGTSILPMSYLRVLLDTYNVPARDRKPRAAMIRTGRSRAPQRCVERGFHVVATVAALMRPLIAAPHTL
jgi:hypothetical protein